MIRDIKDLDALKEKGKNSSYPQKIKISVGMATCGLATGAQEVFDELQKAIEKNRSQIILSQNGCLGFCQAEPLVDVWIPQVARITYKQMTPQKASEIVSLLTSNTVKKDYLLCAFDKEVLVDEVLRKFDLSKLNLDGFTTYQGVPFFSKQKKIVLRNCGFINPDSLEEYIGRGGYYSLYKVLKEFSPGEVIEEVKKSGLRGRGGAGFPTGIKWEVARKAKGETKYIVCNADEGDPGAYMDRSVIEGDPHSIIEGMIIGSYAIGANQGFIYVRSEYPLAVKRLTRAIEQAKEYGLLGQNLFGSGFNFEIEIREGSGAFVCGEETSLIKSIEGDFPEPRQRPPYPAQSGLWGYPTNINNVETWANVPIIIQKGSNWFSQIGTEQSKGTKVFSVVGKINNTGLVEVPMGISLKEIIYDLGGGIPNGKKFKAVQTGGPSGGCIPERLIDLPIDYERLKEAGSIMGSGGMVIMDEDTCMVDVAKFFLNFTSDESCGKCTSCREGSIALLSILTRISEGEGEESDLELLEELCQAVKSASLCGLGQTLPNPVLSTLKYFPEEYAAHVREKQCPARVCKKLISFYIDPKKCSACGLCRKACPVEAIYGEKGIVHTIEQSKCTRCGSCFAVCPQTFSAVVKISGKTVPAASTGKNVAVKKN